MNWVVVIFFSVKICVGGASMHIRD